MEGDPKDQSSGVSIKEALSLLNIGNLEGSRYPILVSVPKEVFQKYNEDRNILEFWKQVFNPQNRLVPGITENVDMDSRVLFILHSFEDSEKRDAHFRAVTTTWESFLKDPVNIINYELHGRPCERRSRGNYPNINFWEFYDKLSELEEKQYAIPDYNNREDFYGRIVSS